MSTPLERLAGLGLPRYPTRDPLEWRREQDERGFADGERGLEPRAQNRYYLGGHKRGLATHARGMPEARS